MPKIELADVECDFLRQVLLSVTFHGNLAQIEEQAKLLRGIVTRLDKVSPPKVQMPPPPPQK